MIEQFSEYRQRVIGTKVNNAEHPAPRAIRDVWIDASKIVFRLEDGCEIAATNCFEFRE